MTERKAVESSNPGTCGPRDRHSPRTLRQSNMGHKIQNPNYRLQEGTNKNVLQAPFLYNHRFIHTYNQLQEVRAETEGRVQQHVQHIEAQLDSDSSYCSEPTTPKEPAEIQGRCPRCKVQWGAYHFCEHRLLICEGSANERGCGKFCTSTACNGIKLDLLGLEHRKKWDGEGKLVSHCNRQRRLCRGTDHCMM